MVGIDLLLGIGACANATQNTLVGAGSFALLQIGWGYCWRHELQLQMMVGLAMRVSDEHSGIHVGSLSRGWDWVGFVWGSWGVGD